MPDKHVGPGLASGFEERMKVGDRVLGTGPDLERAALRADECYFYLDSTPTHSYMKALYKYPQTEYP